MQCPACHADLAPEATFCSECGTRVQQQAATTELTGAQRSLSKNWFWWICIIVGLALVVAQIGRLTSPVPRPASLVQPIVSSPRAPVEVQVYLRVIAAPLSDYHKGLREYAHQVLLFLDDPNVMYDGPWKQATGQALGAMEGAASEIIGFNEAANTAGTEAEELSRLLRLIADETRPLVDDFARAIDEGDGDAMESSSRRLGRISEWNKQVNTELDRLIALYK